MSLALQIALSALVIGGVGFGIWNHKHVEEMTSPAYIQQHSPVQAQATLSTGTDNNDLDKDMQTIDGQLKAVDSGSTEVDQSLNDKSTLETN